MSSGDPGQDQTKVPDSLWASVVGLALGRTPSSSEIRQDMPKRNPLTPALNSDFRTTGQRTDSQISISRLGVLDLETELGEERERNGGDDPRIQELLVRLHAVQGQLDAQKASPEASIRTHPKALLDQQYFPFDSHRERNDSVPARFHAGRESLTVKRNVTMQDSKRPKERSQDREYRQRYSVTPGKQIG